MSHRIVERSRRTQAQRRDATRAALLDATIECLVEDGYASTTTRRIAERAGVTPGALQHHFASKAELVGAAVERIGRRSTEALLAQPLPRTRSRRGLVEQLLDGMWEFHKGPLTAAIGELYMAARNEPGLRARLADAQRDVEAFTTTAAMLVFPAADRREQAALLQTALATLRGLAVVGYADEAARDAAWPATRAHLLRLVLDLDAPARRA